MPVSGSVEASAFSRCSARSAIIWAPVSIAAKKQKAPGTSTRPGEGSAANDMASAYPVMAAWVRPVRMWIPRITASTRRGHIPSVRPGTSMAISMAKPMLAETL